MTSSSNDFRCMTCGHTLERAGGIEAHWICTNVQCRHHIPKFISEPDKPFNLEPSPLPFGAPPLGTLEDSYPDNNPKTAFGLAKAPLHLVPTRILYWLAEAFANGAKKYGPFNWRTKKISATVYYAAALRHLTAWYEGENIAPDSGVHHLAHAAACLAMLADVDGTVMLNDDRPPRRIMETEAQQCRT